MEEKRKAQERKKRNNELNRQKEEERRKKEREREEKERERKKQKEAELKLRERKKEQMRKARELKERKQRERRMIPVFVASGEEDNGGPGEKEEGEISDSGEDIESHWDRKDKEKQCRSRSRPGAPNGSSSSSSSSSSSLLSVHAVNSGQAIKVFVRAVLAKTRMPRVRGAGGACQGAEGSLINVNDASVREIIKKIEGKIYRYWQKKRAVIPVSIQKWLHTRKQTDSVREMFVKYIEYKKQEKKQTLAGLEPI